MQRDLFKADVYAFPLGRTADVPRMARFLWVANGPRAETHYRKQCRNLAQRLRSAGIPDRVIWQQIQEFQAAVQIELQRIYQVNGPFDLDSAVREARLIREMQA